MTKWTSRNTTGTATTWWNKCSSCIPATTKHKAEYVTTSGRMLGHSPKPWQKATATVPSWPMASISTAMPQAASCAAGREPKWRASAQPATNSPIASDSPISTTHRATASACTHGTSWTTASTMAKEERQQASPATSACFADGCNPSNLPNQPSSPICPPSPRSPSPTS